MEKIVLINSPIVTGWGMYNWSPLDLWETKEILRPGFVSAIGHESTARFLSALLDLEIPANRIQVQMGEEAGEFGQAVVLRLKTRLPEGKTLSIEEMEQVEFDLGLLEYQGPWDWEKGERENG